MLGNMAEISSNTSCSNSLNVLKRIAEDFKQFSVSDPTKSNIMSSTSVTLMKVGMSLSRIFFMPGIQSIGVSSVPSCMKFSSEKVHGRHPMKLQAEADQNWTSGMSNSLAACLPNPMRASEIIQVICGTSDEEFSLVTSSLNGPKQVFLVESHKAGASWDTTSSEGGNPSGMVLKWKSDRPLTESEPLDWIKSLWLNSVLTKVMWKPLECRSLANCIMGLTWPCAGKGTQTAWSFLVPPTTESIFTKPGESDQMQFCRLVLKVNFSFEWIVIQTLSIS